MLLVLSEDAVLLTIVTTKAVPAISMASLTVFVKVYVSVFARKVNVIRMGIIALLALLAILASVDQSRVAMNAVLIINLLLFVPQS